VSYSVRIKQSAAKELARIDKPNRERIIAAIDGLKDNPHKGSLLKGELSGLRRIRVGDYRVLYEISQGELIVLVIQVARRRHV
jgi:mRNA interferase RelE/StbE